MNRKIMSLFMILILIVGGISFIIPNVSPLTNANIIYDKGENLNPDLKVKFNDGKNDIGTIELKSHSSVNEIKQVLVGNQVVMWYDFDFSKNIISGLGNIKFINIKTGKEIFKEYNYTIFDNESFEVPLFSCINNLTCIQNGTETRFTNKKWILYNSGDIPQGKATIGIQINVLPEETFDIIWNINGFQIDKHAVVTSGATTTTDGAYTVVKYINNGTFNTTTNLNVEILVVAGGGGGGGGNYNGAGGGAGGLIYNNSFDLQTGNYNIVVGDGGLGGLTTASGNMGQNSSISYFNGTFVKQARGGGYGGNTVIGGNGGSGGGGGFNGNLGGTGTAGQGNNGGQYYSNDAGGGGGGAGSVGSLGNASKSGDGGIGLTYNINGTSICYAGGGGGTSQIIAVGTATCGGANGSTGTGNNGTNGYGGGGGGAERLGSATGGKGGSGVVIIRYSISEATINVHLHHPLNNSVFNSSQTPTFIYFVNSTNTTNLTISNVTLQINFSNATNYLTSVNASGIQGNYSNVVSFPNNNLSYLWDVFAFGSNGTRFNSANGTMFFNITQVPQAAPNQTSNIPNFTMNFNSALNINFNNYFSDLFSNISGFVNISFIDYTPPLTQSLIPIHLSANNNATRYFLNNHFQIIMDTTDLDINSYDSNRTIQINATACNTGGCSVSNTFYVEIREGVEEEETFISKTSNWFTRILPDADNLSFIQKIGLMFIILLFVLVSTFIGLNSVNVEAPANVYMAGGLTIFLLIYFIIIGYISIWLVIGLLILIIAGLYMLRQNGT